MGITLTAVCDMIVAAKNLGINYIFIDKNVVDDTLINLLREKGFSILIGMGANARVKISW